MKKLITICLIYFICLFISCNKLYLSPEVESDYEVINNSDIKTKTSSEWYYYFLTYVPNLNDKHDCSGFVWDMLNDTSITYEYWLNIKYIENKSNIIYASGYIIVYINSYLIENTWNDTLITFDKTNDMVISLRNLKL
jgi:hypothetical protein